MTPVSAPWRETPDSLGLRGKFLAKHSFFTHFCQQTMDPNEGQSYWPILLIKLFRSS